MLIFVFIDYDESFDPQGPVAVAMAKQAIDYGMQVGQPPHCLERVYKHSVMSQYQTIHVLYVTVLINSLFSQTDLHTGMKIEERCYAQVCVGVFS